MSIQKLTTLQNPFTNSRYACLLILLFGCALAAEFVRSHETLPIQPSIHSLIQSTLGSIIKHAVSFQACPKCYAIADIKMDTFDISSLFDYHGNQQIQTSPKTTTGWWRQMCKPRLAELLSRWVWSATLEKAEPGVVIYRFVLSLDHHCLLPLHALITPTVFIRIVTLPIIHHRRWGERDRR